MTSVQILLADLLWLELYHAGFEILAVVEVL